MQEKTYCPVRNLSKLKHEFGEYGGVNSSIHASTTFTTLDPTTMENIFQGESEEGCYLYGRHFQPNSIQLGKVMAAIENTEAGYPVSSGMAAISTVIRQLLKTGDHVVASQDIYGGTYAFFKNVLPKNQIGTTFVDPTSIHEIQNAIQENTKVLYLEMHSNPNLKVLNLSKLSDHISPDITIIIDNTFTPLTYTPKNLGADIVIHSGTKFLNGMSDFISGIICCSQTFLQELMDLHTGELMLSGPTLDPRSAWQLQQNIQTLPLRVQEHSTRALNIAQELESLNKFPVVYPGLPSNPDYEIALEQSNTDYGFGGLIGLDLETQANARKFIIDIQEMGWGFNAVSLGYYQTLLSISGQSTSSEIDPQTQEQMQLSPGFVRISVGYKGNPDDQITTFSQTVKKL